MTIPVSVPPEPSRPGEAQTRGCTTVRTVTLLLAETGSVVVVVTLLMLVSVVGLAGVVTVIAIVIVVPLVIAPRAHVTVEVPEHEPWVVAEETKAVLGGMMSVTDPSAEFDRPRF